MYSHKLFAKQKWQQQPETIVNMAGQTRKMTNDNALVTWKYEHSENWPTLKQAKLIQLYFMKPELLTNGNLLWAIGSV